MEKVKYAGLRIEDFDILASAKRNGFHVQWLDSVDGVVHINEALAQIAEMESADKPHKCEYCAKLSKYAGWGYAEWFEQRAVDDVYEISVDVKFCPNCGNPIASPYTEGEKI